VLFDWKFCFFFRLEQDNQAANMKIQAFGSLKGIATAALLLLTLAQDVAARPSPEPKSAWVRKGAGRKRMSNTIKRSIDKRQDSNDTCAEGTATSISAPKSNVWGELSGQDAADVTKWLFAQSDLNLTQSENATSWDNTM
jgi:primary-amine oxidase